MVSAEERAPAFAPPRRPRAAPIPDHVTLDVGRGHVFAEDQRQRVGGVLQVGFRAVKLLKVLVVLSNVSKAPTTLTNVAAVEHLMIKWSWIIGY